MPTSPTVPDDHAAIRFGDSWRNLTRITTIRIIAQAVVFALFLFFVLLTTFSNLDRYPGLRHWVSKVLEIDPLISMATAITTHTLYRGLWWSLIVLIPTLFLGRFFCNWMCPYGSLHQFVGWLFRRPGPKEARDANRYAPRQGVKYLILVAMLVAAIFGSLQIGLLDPICLLYRSFTGAVLPAANMPLPAIVGDYRLHQGAWLIGVLMFGLVAMNLVMPRFFCRVLCPLGALLGVLSRFTWWRIERDPEKCINCQRCLTNCEGACDPHSILRTSECLVCFNCLEDCPAGALSFKFFASKIREIANPDVSRRQVVLAALSGVLFYPFVRTSGRSTRDFSSKVVRPPGAVEELEFLERCVKCNQCIRVCPTNGLQPDWFESGLEGLWTPVFNFRMGYCQLNCTACGQVCPTGAIQRISVEEKLGLGEFADQGPIRLGTAHFDTGRCLPYSQNITCLVCEEVCPTSPKAIYSEPEMRTVRHGRKMVVASTDCSVTVSEWPEPGHAAGAPARFDIDGWPGDDTRSFHITVRHSDGVIETHRVTGSNADTLMIEGRFARAPQVGAAVQLQASLKIPKIDPRFCIGCGVCEWKCPIVGDRRAIYVTAEGETRSQHYPQHDRNRSYHLEPISKTGTSRGLQPARSHEGPLLG